VLPAQIRRTRREARFDGDEISGVHGEQQGVIVIAGQKSRFGYIDAALD
jgi:hypothetical protein